LDATSAKQELAKELADVVGMAFVNAYVLGIDLEKALRIKWIKDLPEASHKKIPFWDFLLIHVFEQFGV